MNHDEWMMRLYQVGQCNHMGTIDELVSKEIYGPHPVEDRREAAYIYLLVCTDYTKLGGFLQQCDYAARRFGISYEGAANFVANIVAGWCQ